MYDIINNIIDHAWNSGTTSSSAQQYIYYICGAIIILFFICIFDLFKEFIRSAMGKR